MTKPVALAFAACLLGGGAALAVQQQAYPQQPSAQQPQGQYQGQQPQGQYQGCCGGTMTGGMHGMMGCGQMSGQANVSVENTNEGAIIRLTAKDASQVQRVQQMARMMGNCCTNAGSPPSGPPPNPPRSK